MILLNFSHPVSDQHRAQMGDLTGQDVDRVIEIGSQLDPQQPLVPQVMAMVDQCGLSPVQWQTLAILVNPPSLHWVAVTLVAVIHGRCGYFPAHLRLCLVEGTM